MSELKGGDVWMSEDDLVKELLEECEKLRERIEKLDDPKKRENALMCLNRLQQIIVEKSS